MAEAGPTRRRQHDFGMRAQYDALLESVRRVSVPPDARGSDLITRALDSGDPWLFMVRCLMSARLVANIAAVCRSVYVRCVNERGQLRCLAMEKNMHDAPPSVLLATFAHVVPEMLERFVVWGSDCLPAVCFVLARSANLKHVSIRNTWSRGWPDSDVEWQYCCRLLGRSKLRSVSLYSCGERLESLRLVLANGSLEALFIDNLRLRPRDIEALLAAPGLRRLYLRGAHVGFLGPADEMNSVVRALDAAPHHLQEVAIYYHGAAMGDCPDALFEYHQRVNGERSRFYGKDNEDRRVLLNGIGIAFNYYSDPLPHHFNDGPPNPSGARSGVRYLTADGESSWNSLVHIDDLDWPELSEESGGD